MIKLIDKCNSEAIKEVLNLKTNLKIDFLDAKKVRNNYFILSFN